MSDASTALINNPIKPTKKIIRTEQIKGLEKSMELVGQIYPIIIDKNTHEIIDGNKRFKANPNWRYEEVEIKSLDQKLAIKYHSIWLREQCDKAKVLEEVAEETGWRGLEPFAKFFGVSEQTISKYLPQKYKTRIHEVELPYSTPLNKDKGLVLLADSAKQVELMTDRLGETNPILTEKLVSIKETINNEIQRQTELISKKEESPKTEEEKQAENDKEIDKILDEMNWMTSLWRGSYDRPEGYGSKDFHGNCSPAIPMALLKRYSNPAHRVLDPMAGSGTLGDVALAMGYKKENVYLSDIKSIRPEIKEYDTIKLPHEDQFFDFIFTHIPYWNLIQYTTDNPNDSSNMDFNQFTEWCDKLMQEMKRILSDNHYFCLMVGNKRENGVIDLEAKISEIGTKHFKLWDKIVKEIRPWTPEKRGQRMQLEAGRAKSQNRTMVNHDIILIFKKE